MSVTVPNYRWSVDEFIRASDAGSFDHRVELVRGEVWPVVIGGWHGRAVGRVFRLLPGQDVELTAATLPSGDSLPDPDCWVGRAGAAPVAMIGSKVEVWDPTDVLLVVEVSDETLLADLTQKAEIYGAAGWPVYWVVADDAIYVHTEPHGAGYRLRVEYRTGELIPVPYTDAKLRVDEIIGIG